jgi:hypothetical protein
LAICDRANGCSGVDGAWWPTAQDLGAALPDLLSVVGSLIGPVRRVVYDTRMWPQAPSRIIRGDRSVTVDPYRLRASDTVLLLGTHSRDAVLFVVPTSEPERTAKLALLGVAQSTQPMTVGMIRQLLRPHPGITVDS